MLRRNLEILLLASIIAIMMVGCGSASSSAVSDEDLQVLREMRDELRDENSKLKDSISSKQEEVKREISNQEQSENNEEVIDDVDENLKEYCLDFLIEYPPMVVSTCGIFASVRVDGANVFSGDLTKKTLAGFESIPTTWTLFNKEDLNSFRDTFIEFYNSYIIEHQSEIDDVYLKLCEEIIEGDNDSMIEHELNCLPDSVAMNIDGESIDFDVKKVTIKSSGTYKWPDYKGENIGRAFRYLEDGTTAEFLADIWFEIEMESRDTDVVESYFSDMVARADAQLDDYGDFSFIDNTIQIETPSQPIAETNQSEKPEEKKEEPKSSSVVGTWWDPTGYNDAEFTFNADGTGQNFSPSTGKVSYTFTYSIDGNKVTVKGKHSTDSFTLDGDTLIGVDGKYKRK